jgi:hypothetical protein
LLSASAVSAMRLVVSKHFSGGAVPQGCPRMLRIIISARPC